MLICYTGDKGPPTGRFAQVVLYCTKHAECLTPEDVVKSDVWSRLQDTVKESGRVPLEPSRTRLGFLLFN